MSTILITPRGGAFDAVRGTTTIARAPKRHQASRVAGVVTAAERNHPGDAGAARTAAKVELRRLSVEDPARWGNALDDCLL